MQHSIPLLEIEKERAKQRKSQAEGQPRGIKVLTGSNEHERGKARDIIAKTIGFSKEAREKRTG